MRLSEILGSHVVDEAGASLGRVADVRAVQDGPVHPGFGAALRIDGLIVGRRGLAFRLGLYRLNVRGPWPLAAIFGSLEKRSRYVQWERVVSCAAATVHIRGTGDDLSPPPPVVPRGQDQSSST